MLLRSLRSFAAIHSFASWRLCVSFFASLRGRIDLRAGVYIIYTDENGQAVSVRWITSGTVTEGIPSGGI